jgi:hypothetical protein
MGSIGPMSLTGFNGRKRLSTDEADSTGLPQMRPLRSNDDQPVIFPQPVRIVRIGDEFPARPVLNPQAEDIMLGLALTHHVQRSDLLSGPAILSCKDPRHTGC